VKAAQAPSNITAHRRENGESVIRVSPPFILRPGLGQRRSAVLVDGTSINPALVGEVMVNAAAPDDV